VLILSFSNFFNKMFLGVYLYRSLRKIDIIVYFTKNKNKNQCSPSSYLFRNFCFFVFKFLYGYIIIRMLMRVLLEN
jgi:hypothetical protein